MQQRCLFLFLLAAVPLAAQSYDQKLFAGMHWRNIGPFRGGRVLTVAGIPGDPRTYYFGAVAGGIWKSTDSGVSWKPLFEHETTSSMGAIAIADSNHNVIYAGSGEGCIRGNMSYGDGVYKSIDGGQTWKNVGLRDTQHIGALIIDPRDPNVVFVAALGHAYGPNSERGIFRTRDGGKTWDKVLFKDEHTGGIDVVFDPHNSNILFASLWQVMRMPYSLDSGGPGSGLYKSTDGGTTWKRLAGNGLPDGILGRIGVSVSGADSTRVYALIEAEKGGLYRSDDAGEHWIAVNEDERYRQRAWYFTHIFADPRSLDTVYVLNTGLFRSTDAGKTFELLPAPHGDHHGLWIDPENPQRLINGNDGGVTISVDGGRSWTRQNNQPTAQFYHVVADNRFPYYLYGAQQDNTTVGIASRDTEEWVITDKDWYDVGGGESGYIAPDPRDANIVYAGDGGGVVTRFDKRTDRVQVVSPWPLDTSGRGAAELEHRFQWTEPIVFSPHDPEVIYTAAEVVFKTTDRGQSWTIISPDLTMNDKSKQKPSGGPITLDITSVEYYDTVFTLAESPVKKDLIWAGTDDGLIQLTQDGGQHWTNVTPSNRILPEWSLLSLIDASPHDAGTAFAAVDRHKNDDLRPYIYRTDDFGKSWTKITSGIPDGAFVHAVRQDPKSKNLLYAGTELGVYVSFDDGRNWQPLQLNLPTTPIADLIVKDNDLAVATNGRSFWILDDLSPLRQLTPQMAAQDVILYKPGVTYRMNFPEQVDKRRPVGENPPNGTIVSYYLKHETKDEITLDILDSSGKLVRHYSSKPKEKFEQPPEWPDLERPPELLPTSAGMNRFPWNLRYESPTEIPGAFYADNGPEGPIVLPGTYTLKLTVSGNTQTVPAEIKLDPRVKVSEADLQKLVDLEMKVREDIESLHTAVNQIHGVRSQLALVKQRLGGEGDRTKPVLTSIEDLEKKMAPVEQELMQVKMKSSEGNLRYPNELDEQYESFRNSLEAADAAPTQPDYAVFDRLHSRLEAQLAAWKQIASADVPSVNELVRKQNISLVEVPAGK
ncbi:MAG: glycosyl hydrolase [Acidobacteria bacterium]|nr:glycosyl hydrolase [Acidobacteriota bacterium]